MMKQVKLLARQCWRIGFRAIPSRMVPGITPDGLIAPCFHAVSDSPPPHLRHLYRTPTIREFQRDLNWLLKHYTPVSLDQIADHLQGRRSLPKTAMFLSFDDGLRESWEIAGQICTKAGIPVTFFLTTAFLDNQTLGFRHKASALVEAARQSGMSSDRWEDLRRQILAISYADRAKLEPIARDLNFEETAYLQRYRPYLTIAEVRQLLAKGHSVGGHSIDHPPYAALPLQEQLHQTTSCLQSLTNLFSLPVKSFAFPFSSDGVQPEFFQRVLNDRTVDVLFYTGTPRQDCQHSVWRVGAEGVETRPFQQTMRAAIADWRFNQVSSSLRPALWAKSLS